MSQFDNVEFRAFDYDGFKQSLFQLATTGEDGFTQWTDTLTSNQGVMFVEWLSFMSANLCFMQNFHARQAFVPTVTEARNLTKLAKQFDYQIPNNTAAVTDVTISHEDGTPFDFDVIIPALTRLLTTGATQLIWETTADLTIPAGSIEATVAARHQETKTQSDLADGTDDFKSILTYGPYIEDSLVVEVDGVEWVQVDNFLDSGAADQHFRIEVDSDSIPSVIFGDGVNGAVPASGAVLDYTYTVGGGADGNVPPDTITTIEGTFSDVNGNVVDLAVTNADEAEGGDDREEIEVSKLRIPASLSSKEATLNADDFETVIGAVSGVARVKTQTVNDNEDIPENTVIVAILPSASDTLSEALEAQIEAALVENPTTLTLNVILTGPTFVEIPIDVRDLEIEPASDDSSGTFASATITIINNTLDAGDSVTVNGVEFVETTDFAVGAGVNDTALNLANAINASTDPLLQDVSASANSAVVTVQARTTGEHGNDYTLTESDGATNNFTLSGATFASGTDSTSQALVREAIDSFFGRENVDSDGDYTVDFGQSVFRNRLIWLIQDIAGILSFDLETPSAEETALEANEFPTYTLKFTTS